MGSAVHCLLACDKNELLELLLLGVGYYRVTRGRSVPPNVHPHHNSSCGACSTGGVEEETRQTLSTPFALWSKPSCEVLMLRSTAVTWVFICAAKSQFPAGTTRRCPRRPRTKHSTKHLFTRLVAACTEKTATGWYNRTDVSRNQTITVDTPVS